MFRKPKKKKAAGLRKKRPVDDDEDKEDTKEIREALKRAKHEHEGGGKASAVEDDTKKYTMKSLLYSFEDSGKTISQKELATSTVQHHPKSMESISKSEVQKDPKRNKFLAGPIRAPTNIRTTCRFDYQPDICKDYKDTGFCGFGDTCIYLHDRGDSMSGWQLEQAWQEKQKNKKKEQEEQMERFLKRAEMGGKGDDEVDGKNNAEALSSVDDGLPFACFLTRKAFEDPVVTICGHYFSQTALQDYFQEQKSQLCPISKRDTQGIMNQPTKLIAKKRKMLGRNATWQEFFDARGGMGASNDDDN